MIKKNRQNMKNKNKIKSKKIIYVTLIVMMSFFTIFAQNNVMAAKKENKVYTISKKSKLIVIN